MQVRYGKTAITLGLIDSCSEPTIKAAQQELLAGLRDGFISTKALTFEGVQNADIVLVSFAVLSSEKYFSRLARLTGL